MGYYRVCQRPGVKLRRGELTQADLAKVDAGFRRFVAGRARVVEIVADDFYRAAEMGACVDVLYDKRRPAEQAQASR